MTLIAGCASSGHVQQVTVTAGSATVTLPAALTCATTPDGSGLMCDDGENDDDAPHLRLAPGTPLDISVPTAVGDTPWVIVFAYRDAKGAAQKDRTAVFPAKDRYSYHLTPPSGAQLTRLEVQSLYAAPATDGSLEFPAVQTWVLVIDPAGQS